MAERAKRAVKKVQLPVTRLGAAMKTAPKLSDSNAARARVDEWLAEIGSVWRVERVTRALTEFADAALGAAVRYLIRGAAASGKLKPGDPAKPEQGSGYVVLAMGKMGAFELNYSSDIDLIVLYDE